MNPNHYLAVAIRYLLTHRSHWAERVAVGKTLVSSSMIDKVVASLGRRLYEVPVGFKWFVPGLVDGSCCFGGEESAGASFLRHDGTVWTTDKDGLIMDLLAAEITARTGKDPGEHYQELTAQFGTPLYTRVDAPATPEQKAKLRNLSPEAVTASILAGEPIIAKLTRAPGDNAPIGGLKVVTASGWFAARPSGTENIYKIYAESFKDQAHLNAILSEAEGIVSRALDSSIERHDRERGRIGGGLAGFPSDYRASGLLLHVTSLPSPYGIGDVGPAALAWIDRLAAAGQSWWQSLAARSHRLRQFALSTLVFFRRQRTSRQSRLADRGWTAAAERLPNPFVPRQTEVDYNAVIPFKHQLLEKAWANFQAGARADLRAAYEQFCNDQAHWLDDYALFRALKAKFGGAYYLEWPTELVEREPAALEQGAARTCRSSRLGVLCAVPVVSSGRPPEGARARARA